jgi:hypothetical protein
VRINDVMAALQEQKVRAEGQAAADRTALEQKEAGRKKAEERRDDMHRVVGGLQVGGHTHRTPCRWRLY